MSQDNTVNSLCRNSLENSIAFDFDGTLVNCEIRQVEVLRSILRRQEINIIEFDYDNWWNLKINGSSTLDALIIMQINTDIAKKICNSWIDTIENPEWLDLDVLKEDVVELLKKMKEKEKSIFIITARKSEYFFTNQIRKLLIDQYITKSFVVNPQKSIEQKKEILYNIKPTLFVGDTENDFYSAQKSGVRFIATSTGQRSKLFLVNLGVDYIIDKFSYNNF
jgi:phosphoglycolate phosphatase-like HAD superfamily hydrolase